MGSLFKKPKVTQPIAAPDVEDPAVKAAKRRTYDEASQRSGRQSTMLTDDYSRAKLGGQG
jgi:hypothetical protein